MPSSAGHHVHSPASSFYLSKSIAKSTKKAYASGVKLFRQFCCQSGYSWIKPNELTLENFVSFCAQSQGLSYTTIKLYLCGVRHDCLLRDQGDVLKDKPRLDLCMRGIKKTLVSVPRVRMPITTSVLYSLDRVLGAKDNDHTQAMMWAALCVGFYGALRCGEFTVTGDFDRSIHLCYSDIAFRKDVTLRQEYVALNLKASKTDPFRKGCTVLLFATGQRACPVFALRKYLDFSPPCPANFPLFHLADGTPLSRSCYVKMLQEALDKAGYKGCEFNGHSLRKGFATSASAGKVPDHVISTIGRWSSDCYKTYIQTPLSVIADAQRVIADPKIAVDK